MNSRNVNIACITEHWLSQNLVEKINIQDFTVASSFCRTSSRHGGAAIAVRDGILCKEIRELKELSIESEIEVAAAGFVHLKLVIIALYRPPSGDVQLFLSTLSRILENCFDRYENHKIIFSGDFNIDFS